MMRSAVICALLPASISMGQATQSTLEQERAADVLRAEAEALLLPQVQVDSADKVLRITVEDRMLQARTPLRPTGESRIHVPGWRGVVKLRLFGQFEDDELAGSSFQLMRHEFFHPRDGEANTSVSAVGGRIIIARDSERDGALSSVQLIQHPPAPAGEIPQEDPVQLRVNRTGQADPSKDLNLKFSTASFAELRRTHARELDEYFRPIIRDLGQEASVFGVPAEMGWQVLGQDYAPDEALVQKVRQIVERLDADSFRERVQAAEELKQIGQPAALMLAGMDRGNLSPQQISGIDTFLAEFNPLQESQTRELANSRSFLLDVLYADDDALRKQALKRLSELAGREVKLDPSLGPAERAKAIAALRDELLPTTLPSMPAEESLD